MKKYQAKIISGKDSIDLENNINEALSIAVEQGWQLHSQGNWHNQSGLVFQPPYKCTLIFEKEM